MTAGTLFVVATPIGNLDDITIRAVDTLKKVDVIAAEDTRVTAKLLSRLLLAAPMTSIRGEHGAKHVATLLQRLESGENVALVTDAGTPSVSDPGYDLVAAAHEAGIPVSPIPGPSALAAAVSVVGLRGEGVRFLGFLPRSGRRRKELMAALRTERALTVLYESPRRLRETLLELADACGNRQGAVLRELTKIHEEIVRDTLQALTERFSGPTKGEIIIALSGNLSDAPHDLSETELEHIIAKELEAGRTVRDVASAVSTGFGLSRKQVYRMAVAIHQQRRE